MNNLLKEYSNLLVKYDEQMNSDDKTCGRNCSCCEGCDYCCHQLIIITDFEKEIIKTRIYSMYRNEIKRLRKIINEQCEILSFNNITPQTVTPFLNEKIQKYVQTTFFDLNLACPFLKDKSCIIHDTRPMACLTYRNYGNPKDCEKNIFVPEAYTFNNIEIKLRNEIMQKMGTFPQGFNILQFALKEIL